MNPCPCGNLGSRTQPCRCTPAQIHRYLNRISGPLLDRIDMHIEVESIPAESLAGASSEEPSSAIRQRVCAAREIQRRRYRDDPDVRINAHLDARTLNRACPMNPTRASCWRCFARSTAFPIALIRAYARIARTIADLAGADVITAEHVSEAAQYRTLDRKYWG